MITTRFAPAPTGYLHIGNIRTAIVNWLFAKKNNGKFILRIDDTNTEKYKEEYRDGIFEDLKWLGLYFDITFSQSSRLKDYEIAKELLIKSGRLYECFETEEELDIKRNISLKNHKPFIYDRSSLSLTQEQKDRFISMGIKPHYRFMMKNEKIEWEDMIKGDVKFDAKNISDPIIIKQNGSMTYMLCSVVDDMDYNISHIIRGEDHITNTAIQIQMFEAMLEASKESDKEIDKESSATNPKSKEFVMPKFGHLSLIKSRDEKISKRFGGFEISNLRDVNKLQPIAVKSFATFIGTSKPIVPYKNMEEIIENFDISSYSRCSTTYIPEDLIELNRKIVTNMSYSEIEGFLHGGPGQEFDNVSNFLPDNSGKLFKVTFSEDFWLAIRKNINNHGEVLKWYSICHRYRVDRVPEEFKTVENKDFVEAAIDLLPEEEFSEDTFKEWTKLLSEKTQRVGKDLYMPLRGILTMMLDGPELKNILPMIGRDEILSRLNNFLKLIS
jgi:glutamyl-tRNA synthetase